MIHLRIEEELRSNGKSLYWLIHRTGRSYQSLRNLTKKDLSSIHFDTLELLCRAFNCTPGDLLELIDDSEVKENEQNTKAV